MQALEKVLVKFEVSKQDIEKAKAYQAKFGGALERLLINMGSISEDSLPEIYAQLLNASILPLDAIANWQPPSQSLQLNQQFLIARGWVPYRFVEGQWCFATVSPLNWEVLQYLSNSQLDYQRIIATDEVFEQLKLASQGDDVSVAQDYDLLSDVEEDKLRELASEAPTVNLLNSLIARALKLGASDMHLEPHKGRYRVRFRVDGVLHEVELLPSRLQLPVISRLKILANMDIAEKRRPQDGKIEMKISNTGLDIRVSSLPLNEGESMVMRFLRKDAVRYDMSVLGLSPDIEEKIKADLKHTAGVVLLTGPTGSGKTTTLYTFLNELNNDDVKIITLEDPVEYQLEGVNQVQVKPEIGFDFSSGLRSIVRQDPDIIMIGEIRDQETARIAMQSALTGHLVFSTVHTNDAPSAYTRLLDLNVEEFLLNAALVAIIAQRLARKICPHCATQDENAAELITKYQLHALAQQSGIDTINLLNAQGCQQCANTGYKGRMAVIEYLRSDSEIRGMAKDENFIEKAKAYNHSIGNRTLLEDGLVKAMQGLTTIDEVIRVCG
ncbi:general secretion pathway protein E [Colwellia chukchiensis]|uniref:General secretion pathway protein E n=1 Tax=Colwellia chukchiensis TaxID=641665 RepID=A0A1H7HGB6_9GAMM|nr:GspE/PulE family protein [Colwellia chukchiensis]SEK47295.1 general secretion pathway protein E [Colwellia chukchiensis]